MAKKEKTLTEKIAELCDHNPCARVVEELAEWFELKAIESDGHPGFKFGATKLTAIILPLEDRMKSPEKYAKRIGG